MVEWLKTEGLVDYNIAVSFMETRASEIAANKNKELVWLLEHPPLYTAGASANENDLSPFFAFGGNCSMRRMFSLSEINSP